MKKDRGEVRFIRKNGRIIPIRSKRSSSKKTRGSAAQRNKVVKEPGNTTIKKGIAFGTLSGFAAGGLAVLGLESGDRAGRFLDKAKRVGNPKTKERLIKTGFKTVKRSGKFFGSAKGTRLLGVVGAGALIGSGLSKNANAEPGSLADFSISTLGAAGVALTDVALGRVLKTPRGARAVTKILKRRFK